MIMSNSDATYLDCGYAGWVIDGNNWCSPYKGWQVRILIKLCLTRNKLFIKDLYKNNPYDIMRKHGVDEALWENIMGGEAAIWSEQTSEDDVLSKVKYEAPCRHIVRLLSRWSLELLRTGRGCGWETRRARGMTHITGLTIKI